MHQRVTTFKISRDSQKPQELLSLWHRHLEELDRSAGTLTNKPLQFNVNAASGTDKWVAL